MSDAALRVQLNVVLEGEGLSVEAEVTNLGQDVVDPGLAGSTLLVDGERSVSWNVAVGNGAREAKASALPPGESVSVRRVMEGLVRGPGDHELVLEVAGVRSAPVTVEG